MSDLTIAQRITNGVAYLDEHVPDWLDVIDVDRLDLQQDCSCVLGQLVKSVETDDDWLDGYTNVVEKPALVRGNWHPAPEAAEQLGMPEIMSFQQSVDNGFHTGDFDASDSEWLALTSEWRERITQLRKNRGIHAS